MSLKRKWILNKRSFGLCFFVFSLSLVLVLYKNYKDIERTLTKREQTLQVDICFMIPSSMNITNSTREKIFQEAIEWSKLLTRAFGEIGINKTRIALILYGENAKLMFNFTDKMDKQSVMEGLDEASEPPALGNETSTEKALEFALDNLVNQTREDAVKIFFVFADHPADDNTTAIVTKLKEKDIEVFGLGLRANATIDENKNETSEDNSELTSESGNQSLSINNDQASPSTINIISNKPSTGINNDQASPSTINIVSNKPSTGINNDQASPPTINIVSNKPSEAKTNYDDHDELEQSLNDDSKPKAKLGNYEIFGKLTGKQIETRDILRKIIYGDKAKVVIL
ncbi:uncharacterized protein LOC124442699 [Xenia sp. Carnegie-2017]|uniref:uncharacterized protein LOC124442699 n=1 Tax=Xenia sp. Carnegie-2017 TaxID=2897299 RepID=UPI001F0417A1|nr:uncharacterized protein LOC124442699 [Xenia sp. Carnegie-2017]